jgi:hypothetical protein
MRFHRFASDQAGAKRSIESAMSSLSDLSSRLNVSDNQKWSATIKSKKMRQAIMAAKLECSNDLTKNGKDCPALPKPRLHVGWRHFMLISEKYKSLGAPYPWEKNALRPTRNCTEAQGPPPGIVATRAPPSDPPTRSWTGNLVPLSL